MGRAQDNAAAGAFRLRGRGAALLLGLALCWMGPGAPARLGADAAAQSAEPDAPQSASPPSSVVSGAPGGSAPLAPAGPVFELSLPGRPALSLPALPGPWSPPLFAVGPAASYAGFGVRWRSSEKTLELRPSGSAPARLVLDSARVVYRGRLFPLPLPLELADGAPALDADGLRLLLDDLGAGGSSIPSAPNGSGSGAPAPGEPEAAASPVPGLLLGGASAPSTAGAATPVPPPLAEPEPESGRERAAARPLTGAGIRTIVIDPGHGGKDPGARGPDGLREKDVCLDIALRLRRELARRDPSLRVILTRDDDYFVTLAGRTQIANRDRGDLFVSIHNNASSDPDAHGTQVFFFDSQSSDRAAADLTLRENGEANQLDILMTDLAKSVVRDQSIGFASLVQRALGNGIELKRRRVSYAPFYVLARTEMPAILVEVAFITNPHEEALLGSQDFRQRVAGGLASGIEHYVRMVSGSR